MSKAKAFHWPVLATTKVVPSTTTIAPCRLLSSQATDLATVSCGSGNAQLRRKARSSSNQIGFKSTAGSRSISTSSGTRSGRGVSILMDYLTFDSMNSPIPSRCFCPSIRHSLLSAGRRQQHHHQHHHHHLGSGSGTRNQTRQSHSQTQSKPQSVEPTKSSSSPQPRTRTRQRANANKEPTTIGSNSKTADNNHNPIVSRTPRTRVSRKGSSSSPAKAPSIPNPSVTPIALTNLRLLIHTNYQLASRSQRTGQLVLEGIDQHRKVSSIVPPLAALQSLVKGLESAGDLSLLTSTDWDALIQWFVYHNDHHSLAHLHRLLVSAQNLHCRCSSSTYCHLVEGHISELRRSKDKRLPSSQTELSDVVKHTVEWMRTTGVTCNRDIFELWLKICVEEKNWKDGVDAWTAMKSWKFTSTDSDTPFVFAVLSHLHHGQLSDAGTLLQSTIERSMAAQRDKSYITVSDLSSGTTRTETETEIGVIDGKADYLRRQKQTLQELYTLQERITPTTDFLHTTDLENIEAEWRTAAYPAMIEIISLGEPDRAAASLASDLAVELRLSGSTLDHARFRLLTRYIGSSVGSEGAELFLLRWMEANKKEKPISSSAQDPKPSIESPIQGATIKKTNKVVNAASVILVEIGLQEVLKRAAKEGNLERACRIFDGMSRQGIPLDVDASEVLVLKLCVKKEFRTALTVLRKSLHDKRVPSIETVNGLLQELIRDYRLDDSVAVFRDLTETPGLRPDQVTFRRLLSLTSMYGQLEMSERLLSTLSALGVKRDGEIYRDLIRGYVRSGNLEKAIKVFENMDLDGVKHDIRHINVLLEGAVNQSSSATVVGILEIMASLGVRPSAETWNILLRRAFQTRDASQAKDMFRELSHSVVEGLTDKADGSLRASRHQDTFPILVKEYAMRHGNERAVRILKAAVEAGYPRGDRGDTLLQELQRT
ncbi:hypothetical protein BGZ83_001494 [Gryganskiella cystojenkinii]|nr:hypothetical protein BGZ83_001494 [Gryganskiella cystojenkinii]